MAGYRVDEFTEFAQARQGHLRRIAFLVHVYLTQRGKRQRDLERATDFALHAERDRGARAQPLDATPLVHAAALAMCTRDWTTALDPESSNMLPTTAAEATGMCAMQAETVMTLLPEARVTMPEGTGTFRPGTAWQVTTPAGETVLSIHYLWPDGWYGKKNYGLGGRCQPNPVNEPTVTYVADPSGTPFPMRNWAAGQDQRCVQVRPAPQFFGAITTNLTDGTVEYSVRNDGYGSFGIGTGVPSVRVTSAPTTGSYSQSNGEMFISRPDNKAR